MTNTSNCLFSPSSPCAAPGQGILSVASIAYIACLAMGSGACASGKVYTDVDATVIDNDASTPLDAVVPDANNVIASACPPGEFATGFDTDGLLQCATIDEAAKSAVNDHCSVYMGWRDNCNGCTSPPAKWGLAGGAACTSGTGVNNTCTTTSLGGVNVDLFGLATGGDVDDNDTFYSGFHCVTPDDTPQTGPCPQGSFLAGITVKGTQCVTAHGAITDHVRSGCSMYAGWRDSCDGCTSAPVKWGRVNSVSCSRNAGLHGTCTVPTLAGQPVNLLGLNTDGEVNDDDKFYVGFQCEGAENSSSTVAGTCPLGELVVAIDNDGSVQCASPVLEAEAVVRAGCFLYFGWRDSCGGCTTAPAKWGRVNHAMCENGVGGGNTCASTPLDGTSISLFGLNTDGNVNDDDKFYVGLTCP